MLVLSAAALLPPPKLFQLNHLCNPLIPHPQNCNNNKKLYAVSERVLGGRDAKQRISTTCQSAGDRSSISSSTPVSYEGVYGPWTLDSSDVQEVILYRSGLVTAAASFLSASSTAFLPNDSFLVSNIINPYLNLFCALGAAGLGLSLFLIHIYITEIKRSLQALWALGAVGSLATAYALAQPADQDLVHYVVNHPSAIWLVGPLFAAFTGLVFKEGLCYGKLEAGILTFLVPLLLLGHLSGVMGDGVKITLLGVWMGLFLVFAGRKFTQPIKDDIGDKSVFIFNALPEEEKRALVEKLERQKDAQYLD